MDICREYKVLISHFKMFIYLKWRVTERERGKRTCTHTHREREKERDLASVGSFSKGPQLPEMVWAKARSQ